ncbi:putative competence-damage inducible protein [Paenibacillus sp. CCS19]|uniref:competence/damage-inducible protein A n=1 Tax=Paenibacillus sp. CCS19 TaxID=3158387 RepID=UPI00256BE704|nr:competence/damage-inducible protein A [Paenibacillus cellulosilyticus]GMK42264.1 putative competence-damage inducible protein [Paenibacillus cellulosilyticus]
MKAEIIAVGTELLLGQIVNTNAQYLSRRLADLGIDVYYQTVVGDNPKRIRNAIETARSRADLLLFTGGLGPTQDDLTKDVLADYLGRELTYDQPSMDKIVAFFQDRGIHMVDSNKRQATSIVGAVPLFNEAGLAVGNALHVDGTRYLLLPGPPREMKPMFEGPALTWLLGELGTAIPLYSRLLKFAGIGESKLEHELLPLIEGQTDPTIAPYAKEGEVAIRVSTKAATAMEAQTKLDDTVDKIKQLVGAHLFAQEDIPLEEAVVRLLRLTGRTMVSAESCSGGMFAELITNIPGSSGEYAGGVVTYTNMMKHQLLGIPMSQLEGDGAPGAISESTAAMMAERVREIADADYGISITGVAGPAESEGKPVGLVYYALAQRSKPTDVHTMHLSGTRDIIRVRAVKAVLYRLWQALGGAEQQ